MCAGKLEYGVVVIEGGRFPGARRMALFAIRPELSTVWILVGVASVAGLRGALEHVVLVARGTSHRTMGAGEFEDRIVVIEVGRFPSAGRMALFAGGSELPSVRILVGVACKAGLRGALEHTVDMTGGAFHGNMCAGWSKSCEVVVEGGRFPGTGGVALRAVRPELAHMRIGLLVTGKTVLGSAFEDPVDVAGLAFDC